MNLMRLVKLMDVDTEIVVKPEMMPDEYYRGRAGDFFKVEEPWARESNVNQMAVSDNCAYLYIELAAGRM